MKKFFEQKKSALMSGMSNNKGFSLVELIIVVAIMAVLMGVLAPQYLKFVESSRLQADMSAANEIVKSMKIAIATQTSTPTGSIVTWNTTTTTISESLKVEQNISGTSTVDDYQGSTKLGSELYSVLGRGGSSVGTAASSTVQSFTTVVFNIAEDNGVPFVWTPNAYVSYSLGIPNSADVNDVADEAAADAFLASL